MGKWIQGRKFPFQLLSHRNILTKKCPSLQLEENLTKNGFVKNVFIFKDLILKNQFNLE
jgi:hypothetical protein